MKYQKGELLFYQLKQGLYTRFIPAVVLNVGPKRVVIRDFLVNMRRIVSPKSLFRVVLPGANVEWTKKKW